MHTWKEIEDLCAVLHGKLPDRFASISTVSRGGLVPARLVADLMGIDRILVDRDVVPSDSLFVDDIYDSGKTFRRILAKAQDPDSLVYATLFARRGRDFPKQLVYASLTVGTEYVVFPWERLEAERA